MPSRYICSVLDEMRKCISIHRVDLVIGLIEEAQTLVNRMEAKLEDYSDMGYDLKRAKELKKDVRELRDQFESINSSIESVD